MPINQIVPTFSGESFFIPLVLVCLLYLAGQWAELVFPEAIDRFGRFAIYPLLGLISLTSLITAGSYAGIPISQSAFVVLLFHIPFSILGARRAHTRSRMSEWSDKWLIAIIAVVVMLFLWPYSKDRTFFVFGDSYTYMTIADYLREHSYRDAPLDFDTFPWKSHTAMYVGGHYRIGAQAFLALVSACFGISSDRAFMPVTGSLLAVSFLSLAGFLRSFSGSAMSRFTTMALYVSNIFFVLGPSVNNFLPQIPGISCVILLFAISSGRISTSDAVLRGVIGAGILLFYPEIAIFAVGGVLCNFAISLLRKEIPLGGAVRSVLTTLGVAVLVNPLVAYSAIYSLFLHSKARSGYDVPLSLSILLRSIVGYQGLVESSSSLLYVGITMGILGIGLLVWGILRLEIAHRYRWLASAVLFVFTGFYTYFVADYSYATFKTLNYGFFLIATAIGFGWGNLWDRFRGNRLGQGAMAAIALVWAFGLMIIFQDFLSTHYDMVRHPIHAHAAGLRGFAQEYEDLTALARIPGNGEETIAFIPTGPVERWATFYYRSPLDLYFREGVPQVGAPKLPRNINQNYVLGETGATAFQDPKSLIFGNSRFIFSKAQPTLSLTNRGWYPEEIVRGIPRRWMGNQSELVVWMPKNGLIRLQSNVGNPSFPKPQALEVLVDEKLLGQVKLETADSLFDTGEFALAAGVHIIRFKALNVSKASATGDTRLLTLLWERMRFAEPTPSEIVLSATKANLQIKGLSADRWLMDSAAEFMIAIPTSAQKYLRVKGDLPGIPLILPQTVIATFGGGAKTIVTIEKPGPFEVDIPIPAGVSGNVAVTLRAGKTFSPAAISANPDTRLLGMFLYSIAVKN